jgi:hypothetical protein
VIRLRPLIGPGLVPPTDRQRAGNGDERESSLLVVGRGETIIGVPTASMSCILEIRQERVTACAQQMVGGVKTFRLPHRDREISVVDSSSLLRRVRSELSKETQDIGRQVGWHQPC